MKANLTYLMQFIHSCVNEKHELNDTLQFLQCLFLNLRDKLLFLHQCIEDFLSTFNCNEVKNLSSDKYEVKNR